MKTLASPTAGAVTAARRSGVALAALACSAAVTVKAEDGLDRAPNAADAADAVVPADAAPASAVPPAAGPLMAALPPGLPERRQADASPANTDPGAVLVAGSADALVAALGDAGVSYSAARDAGVPVPRVRVAALPDDLDALDSVRQRKAAFFNTVLPIILQVNEAILADRARLADLRARLEAGATPSDAELDWLDALAAEYEVDDGDMHDLTVRVDVIPPSMALAMAALESGWGTSRIARRGNALFGQITTAADGMPSATGHVYARFDTLYESVASYARNLNTHPAYRRFRALRADQRAAGQPLDGHALMDGLEHYSELGRDYIVYVRRMMRDDALHRIDDARLAAPAVTEVADAGAAQ
jgi:Bax protein